MNWYKVDMIICKWLPLTNRLSIITLQDVKMLMGSWFNKSDWMGRITNDIPVG